MIPRSCIPVASVHKKARVSELKAHDRFRPANDLTVVIDRVGVALSGPRPGGGYRRRPGRLPRSRTGCCVALIETRAGKVPCDEALADDLTSVVDCGGRGICTARLPRSRDRLSMSMKSVGDEGLSEGAPDDPTDDLTVSLMPPGSANPVAGASNRSWLSSLPSTKYVNPLVRSLDRCD